MTYGYDVTGIRISALDESDTNGDGTWDGRIQTEYLNDPRNFTGYSQVLRETHSDANTAQLTKDIDYAVRLEAIAQTVTAYVNDLPTSSATDVFGHDGHGSVRVRRSHAAGDALLRQRSPGRND